MVSDCKKTFLENLFVDIRLHPGITTPFVAVAAQYSLHVSASRSFRPNVTSSWKPEVHNVAQRRQRKTEPRPQRICTQNFVQIGSAVPEICSQTDRQTHRWVDYNTLHPYWGRVVNAVEYLIVFIPNKHNWVCRAWLPTWHIIGHFGDESFQAIDCTGTDNQTTTKKKYIKYKITHPNRNKLALGKTQKNTENLILKQFICKNCSCQCAVIVHNCVTQYSTEQFW